MSTSTSTSTSVINPSDVYITEIATIVIGSISFIASISLVFILLYYSYELLSGKSFMNIILMIAICNTITSICFFLGYPSNHLCDVQGFLLIFSIRAVYLWTDVLVLQLYSVILYKRHIKIKHMQALGWSICIILQFILYSTGTQYGQDDPVEGYTLCFMRVGSGSVSDETFWQNFSFLGLCIVSFLFILIVSLRVLFYHCNRKEDSLITRDALNEEKFTIMLIPTGLFISWIPAFLWQFHCDRYYRIHLTNPSKYLIDINAFSCLNPLYGIFLSILIYTRTEKPREKWHHLFKTIYNYICNKNDDISENSNDDYSSNPSTQKSNEIPSRITYVNSNTSNEVISRISEIKK